MLGTIKFVDKSVNDDSARRLDHCDVIASRSGFGVPTDVLHNEVEIRTEFKSFTVIYCDFFLFKYRGGDNVHWISKNKMAATAVQWELCGTNFRENTENLWVSCYNGNNDRSARVLFVQHPREQGEWLHQTLATLVFWLHHSPCSLGCWTSNTLAARSLSPKHTVESRKYRCIYDTINIIVPTVSLIKDPIVNGLTWYMLLRKYTTLHLQSQKHLPACIFNLPASGRESSRVRDCASCNHYSNVIMSTITSQITGVSIVYPTVCSGADQRKHQSSTSLAFVRGIHRW